MHVEYVSERTETFLDLAMNVKNCEGLEQSFAQYVEEEILDKENKYRANEFGLQDARKSNRFESFPPVLQLQLKRFEYDFQRDGKYHLLHLPYLTNVLFYLNFPYFHLHISNSMSP
jgi:ubiquitin carboxyl-terminal hydrolase 7